MNESDINESDMNESDELVQRGANGGIGRREFVKRSALAVSLPAVAGIVAACGGEEKTVSATTGGQGTTAAPEATTEAGEVTTGTAGGGPRRKMVWVTGLLAEWTAPLISGMKDFTDRFDWDLEFVGPSEFDVPTILSMTETVIETNPDVLISMMNAPNAYVPVLQKALDKGITVIVNNVQVAEDVAKLGVPYVGQDEFQAGVRAGTRAADLAVQGGRTDGVILVGLQHPDSANMIQQLAGIEATAPEYNKAKGTSFTVENFADESLDVATGIPRYEAKITALGDDLAAIIASSHGGGLAVQDVLTRKGYSPGELPVGVIGFVGDFTGPQIKEGWVQFGLDQQTYMQGYMAAAIAWAKAERLYGINSYDTVGDPVTIDNVDVVAKRESIWHDVAKDLGLV